MRYFFVNTANVYYIYGTWCMLTTLNNKLRQRNTNIRREKKRKRQCCSMYRVVHGSAPTYLTELCQPCSDTRLRSTSRGDFIVPQFNCQLSNSSFSVAAPSAWNRLPSHIRTSSTYTLFLTRLKTHLFAESLL